MLPDCTRRGPHLIMGLTLAVYTDNPAAAQPNNNWSTRPSYVGQAKVIQAAPILGGHSSITAAMVNLMGGWGENYQPVKDGSVRCWAE